MVEVCKKDFSNGKIYSIRNNMNDDVYVGSTTQPLSKRMARHRGNVNGKKCFNYKLYQTMREIGVENFYIELIENYPCENVEQLRKREGEWIRQVGTINTLIAGRTMREYQKENRDELLVKCRENYLKNIDQKKEYDKNRYEQNKEKLSEQKKIQYQKAKEEVKQRTNKYYYENKDVIQKRTKQIINCDCGISYTYGNKLRHLKSQKHQAYLQQNNNNLINNIDNVSSSQEECKEEQGESISSIFANQI